MSIPCIDNKCLLLPACMQKEAIDCLDILKYFRISTTNELFVEDFERLHEVLPKMKYLSSNKSWIRIYEYYKTAKNKNVTLRHHRTDNVIRECDMIQAFVKVHLGKNKNDK